MLGILQWPLNASRPLAGFQVSTEVQRRMPSLFAHLRLSLRGGAMIDNPA
jgi:hypothetical protein